MKAVVRSELQNFKAEMLLELRQSAPINGKPAKVISEIDNIERRFQQNYKPVPKQKVRFGANPILSILNEVTPLSASERADQDGPGDASKYNNPALAKIVDKGFNVPTTETGQPMNAPKGVLDAMNRDYSSMFRTPTKIATNLREQFMSMQEDINDNSNNEEDLSWLNEVG